jgi:hypothetical protein
MNKWMPEEWKGTVVLDDGGKKSDWLHVDIVDMGIDTQEKFMTWLATKWFSLAFYMKSKEWERAIEAYPWAKEMNNVAQEG